MKVKSNIYVVLAFSIICIFATQGAYASEESESSTTAKEVKQEVAEAVCAIKNYSVNQKDEAVKDIKKLIDNSDARIESVENWMEKKQSQMSQTTREKAKATLKELRKQRNEVAEWYGGLKYSSAEAWEDVKQGFSNGYNTLTKSLSKALNEFSD